ncbi:MAG TPA: dephospho-CoA kinase [Gemmatimonadales bacterium]|nr:dephospho-CoA kinase [Gemmatimonadales bacterium]
MLSVALTGNVAAGKSTVLAHFAHWGAVVVDTDQLAREAVAPGRPALAAILARFGDDLALADGSLDRALLRRRVMGDDERRAVLNAITHPEVMRLHAERLEDARKAGAAIVVSDIPLLFEVLDPDAWDVVVLVDAPEETRRRRLVELRGYADEEARDVMSAQLSSRFKRAKSHIVIDNDGSLEALQANARAAWDALTAEVTRRRNARR